MKDQLKQAILAFADLGIQERVEAINEVKAKREQDNGQIALWND